MPANLDTSPWTDDRIALLKKLWIEGVRVRDIADQLGYAIGRNAIMGKAKRLNLGEHPTRTTARDNRKASKTVPRRQFSGYHANSFKITGARPPSEPSFPPEPAKPPEYLGLGLLELGPRQCRYSHSDSSPYLFCGSPTEDGSSWCRYHTILCFNGFGQYKNAVDKSYRPFKG